LHDWYDEPGLPYRVKSAARRAVREILLFWLASSLFFYFYLKDPSDSGFAPLLVSMFTYGPVSTAILWPLYRLVRFALGR
jgi:hypothetical protein